MNEGLVLDSSSSRDAAYYARLTQINDEIARQDEAKRKADRSGNARLAERHSVAIVRLLKEQQLLNEEYDPTPTETIAIPHKPSDAEQGVLDSDIDSPATTRLYPRIHSPNESRRPPKPRRRPSR